MALFVWTPRLAVGFPDMDDQHQRLVGLMNRLQEGGEAHAPKAELVETLSELGALAVEHFRAEEQVMASFEYPDQERHRYMHVALLERFGEHQRELDARGAFTKEISEFLWRWLTAHIAGPDTKYGVYSGQLTSRDYSGA
ncbi:MAG: bacteriohemerythrin [Acidimicrobiales bacterium]